MARTQTKRRSQETEVTKPKSGKRSPSPIYLDPTESFDNVVVLQRPRRKRRIVFGWYGGKFSHLELKGPGSIYSPFK